MPCLFVAPIFIMPTLFSDEIGPSRTMLNFAWFGQKHAVSQNNAYKKLNPNISEWLVLPIGCEHTHKLHHNCFLANYPRCLWKMDETTCGKNVSNKLDILPDVGIWHNFSLDIAIRKVGSWSFGSCVQLAKNWTNPLAHPWAGCVVTNFYAFFSWINFHTESFDLELQTRMCAVLCKQTGPFARWFACKFHGRCFGAASIQNHIWQWNGW